MTCANCGAELKQNDLICPYCKSEIEEAAKKTHEDFLDEYERKTRELENLPDKTVAKISRYLLFSVGILLFLFAMVISVNYIVSKVRGDNSIDVQNGHLAVLDDYYINHEYEKMYEYLDKKDLHGATYEKYWRIGELDRYMGWRIEALAEKVQYIGGIEVTAEEFAICMGYSFKELVRIEKMKNEGFIYGEGEAALEIKECYVSALKEYMLLTDEEIALGIAEYGNQSVHIELAKKAIERLEAK